jgi:hypothetical protein
MIVVRYIERSRFWRDFSFVVEEKFNNQCSTFKWLHFGFIGIFQKNYLLP